MAEAKRSGKKRAGDQRQGRVPFITSLGGNLIWSCQVDAQPANTRLVLRADAHGELWAAIATFPTAKARRRNR